MKTIPAGAVVMLLAAASAGAQARDASIRIGVRVGQGDAEGAAESADDVRAILQRQKPGAVLALAADGDAPEMVLWLTRRFRRIDTRPESGSPAERPLICIVQAVLDEPGLADPLTRTRPVEAGSVIWREAAAMLVKAVAQHVESRQHILLRQRADWPVVAFYFEELTKEPKQASGAKEGQVVVTAVDAQGAGHDAGLQVGDVVLSADGKKLKGPAELARAIYGAAHGTGIKLEAAQRATRRTLTLTVP